MKLDIVSLVMVIVLLLLLLHFLFPPFEVIGDSMHPTYIDGELLFGTRLFRKSNLKAGDVVLYHCPTDTKKVVIKRVRYVSDDKKEIYCLGDNSEVSYDSRNYGFFATKFIICKVIDTRRNMNHDKEGERN